MWGGGGERLYTYRYTVTTRMTYALKWAVVRTILMFHNCEGQSHKTVSTDHNFRRERRAETDSNRGPSAYKPNALPPGQTGSHFYFIALFLYCIILYIQQTSNHICRKKLLNKSQKQSDSLFPLLLVNRLIY